LNYNISKIRSQILLVHGDEAFVDASLLYLVDSAIALSSTASTYYKPISVHLNQEETINFAANIFPTTKWPADLLASLFSSLVSANSADIFGYPSGSDQSYVTVTTTFNNTVLLASVIIVYHNCDLPAPFYGAYCLEGQWSSTGDLTLLLDDVIASTSTTHHFGSIGIEKLNFYVEQSTFLVDHNFTAQPNSTLYLSNASLQVGETLTMTGSILQTQAWGTNITTSTLFLQNATLVVDVDVATTNLLIQNGKVSVLSLKCATCVGSFDSVLIPNLTSSITKSGCKNVQVSQDSTQSSLDVFLYLTDCDIQEARPQFVIPVVIVCVLVPILILACVLGKLTQYKRDKALKGLSKKRVMVPKIVNH